MPMIDNGLGDFKSLGDLDKVAVVSKRGFVKVRIGFVVTLFFNAGNTSEKRLAFTEVLRHFYETFSPYVTNYQRIGAGRLSRIRDMSFLDHYEQNATRAPADDSEDPDANVFAPHLYGYPDGEDLHEPPLYYCGGSCLPINQWFSSGWASHLDAHIPASWVERNGYSTLVDLLQHWCNILKPMHGTAGLGTLFDQGSSRQNSGPVAFPLIKRFSGLDYNDSRVWCVETHKTDGRTIRTTNWLNVLDNDFVAQLGGIDELKDALGSKCLLHAYEGGVIVQAGPQAELGDVNRGIIPEHYRTVAKVLRPLRFENYTTPGLIEVPYPMDPVEETKLWIARFDE